MRKVTEEYMHKNSVAGVKGELENNICLCEEAKKC